MAQVVSSAGEGVGQEGATLVAEKAVRNEIDGTGSRRCQGRRGRRGLRSGVEVVVPGSSSFGVGL